MAVAQEPSIFLEKREGLTPPPLLFYFSEPFAIEGV